MIYAAKCEHTHLCERLRSCGGGNGHFLVCPWRLFLCRQAQPRRKNRRRKELLRAEGWAARRSPAADSSLSASVSRRLAGCPSASYVGRRIGRPSMFLRPKRPSLPIVVPPAVTRSRRHTVCRGISIVRSHVFRSNACSERLPSPIIVEECGDENVVTMSV